MEERPPFVTSPYQFPMVVQRFRLLGIMKEVEDLYLARETISA
jgi:hypothetical protein